MLQLLGAFFIINSEQIILDRLGEANFVHTFRSSQFVLLAVIADSNVSQEMENGGIADRPGDMPDVFHTIFGVAGVPTHVRSGIASFLIVRYAGLSLLGYPGLVDLDPVYCMPAQMIESKGLRKAWKALERRSL